MSDIAYYIHHVTTQDDRLDLISHKYFGNIGMMNAIVTANPNLPLTDSLPAGLIVNVPVYTSPTSTDSEVKPWLA